MVLHCCRVICRKLITTRSMVLLFVLACLLATGTVSFLKVYLPKPLPDTDVYHRMRVYMDRQRFSVDDEDLKRDDVPIQIHVDEKRVYDHLLKVSASQAKITSKDPVFGHFSQLMSLQEQVNMMVTVETFVIACQRTNLTYFLWGGSLIGAYRHHGLIPWDDDFDVVMKGADWRKIRNVLSRVQGYQLLALGGLQWKFFKTDLPVIPGEQFKWPFLDIFFFTEDSTHVWSLTNSLKLELVNHREDIFPVHFRPFGQLLLAVPCKKEDHVRSIFEVNECRSPVFSHRYSKTIRLSTVMPCSRLYNHFPFVFREKKPNSATVTEMLKLGDTILSNISVPRFGCAKPAHSLLQYLY